MESRTYTIEVPDEALQDLRRRLERVRLPEVLSPHSWDDGASMEFVRRLLDRWQHGFHWRERERELNHLPQYLAKVDGLDVHYVHLRGIGPAPLPLILTHGWPGSFAEMARVVPLLADPGAHGGDPRDAFDVVVPSLPGYGFSQAPPHPGVGSRTIARTWLQLMAGLDYARFGVQGGDIGAGISLWAARQAPRAVVGAHVNYVPGSYRPSLDSRRSLSSDESAFLDRSARFAAEEGAYAALHATKPQTLAFALADSPTGLAVWMAEKFAAWSDHNGDIEAVISLDAVLTNVALHWFSGNAAAALRLYKENRIDPLAFAPGERVATPVGVALFPRELPMPPRSWVERAFDVRRWTTMPRGGHFAALEQPEALVEDIRAFFRALR